MNTGGISKVHGVAQLPPVGRNPKHSVNIRYAWYSFCCCALSPTTKNGNVTEKYGNIIHRARTPKSIRMISNFFLSWFGSYICEKWGKNRKKYQWILDYVCRCDVDMCIIEIKLLDAQITSLTEVMFRHNIGFVSILFSQYK